MPCLFLAVTCMTTEGTSGSELTESVTYHILCNVNRNEILSVMNGNRMTHEIGGNDGCACPSLDDRALAAFIHCENLILE